MIEVLPIVLLVVLFGIGVPIGIALGVTGLIGIYTCAGWDALSGMASIVPHGTTASFTLASIPMFILMAEFVTSGGLARDLFDTGNKWLGHLPGGLGLAAVAASAGMGAMSGSSAASAAAIAGVGMKQMLRHQYHPSLAAGTIASGGTLAIMIPPSIPLLVYGVQTETSIGSLFIAGIIPGIIIALSYMVVVVAWVKLDPSVAMRASVAAPWRERLASLKSVGPVILLVGIVIGGIYGGLFTATEGGAFGAFGALVIALAMRRLRLSDISTALYRAAVTTSMLMVIVVGAHFFSYYLTLAGATTAVHDLIKSTSLGPVATMVLIIVPIYLVLGMFMDNIPILLLTLPVLFPIVTSMGFDPIWFGIVVTALGEIGLITPPVGLSVFVVSSVTKVPLEQVFRGVMPFVIAMLLCIGIFIAFPGLVTFLPNLK